MSIALAYPIRNDLMKEGEQQRMEPEERTSFARLEDYKVYEGAARSYYVMSIPEAVSLVESGTIDSSDTCVIASSSAEPRGELEGVALQLRYSDTYDRQRGMRPHLARRAAGYIRRREDKSKLVTCCDYGMSRSAAMMYAILKTYEGDDAAASLLGNARGFKPNGLVAQLMADALNVPVRASEVDDLYDENV